MPDEDSIDIPPEWYAELRPRRGSTAFWLYQVTDVMRADLAAERACRAVEFDEILSNPASDPRIVAAARSGERSIEAAGARFGIDYYVLRGESAIVLVDNYVQELGLPLAAAACVESAEVLVYYAQVLAPGGRGSAVFAHTPTCLAHPDDRVPQWISEDPFDHLRRLLARADDAEYRATIELLTPFRNGTVRQRILTSYLIPDRHDWVAEDLADELPANGFPGPDQLLLFSAFRPEQLSRWVGQSMAAFVTTLDVFGHAAVPHFLRWLDWWFIDLQTRQRALDVLTRIPADAAFDGLLSRAGLADVPTAIAAAAERFPKRALRLMAARYDEPYLATLLAQHLARHPELAAPAEVARHPIAPDDQLPVLLTAPPWTRPRPMRAAIVGSAAAPEIHWLPGEQEAWSRQWWAEQSTAHWAELLAKRGPTVRFMLGGPAKLVRPLLQTWQPEKEQFGLENPQALVAKYELDALAPALRLARRKPSVGALLLLPYRSGEVAQLMATWLVGSRQFRPLAVEWFDRHGAAGVAFLLPAALGGQPAESRPAALALSKLDPAVVRAAAAELGCVGEVDALLARDPLDLVPAKIPAVPKWLNLDVLPQVLLRDTQLALPAAQVGVLCQLIAMSQLTDRYHGLQVIAEACDSDSLAEFVWALYCSWHLAERPGKDSWALDALGYFGNERTADQLAPLVQRWPSDGAAARAKRGVSALAAMDCDAALRHLGAIARSAKSNPLRAHAAAALDQAALDRGLLPEQLDDLLAPGLGLGSEIISYQGTEYRYELGAQLDLVLQSAGVGQLKTLPKSLTDDDRAIASGWNRQRRQAKDLIADQVRRLEEAMVLQRRWTVDEFGGAIIAHPLLGRLAQRLVWNADGQQAIVDPLGDLVDLDGSLLSAPRWVQLAHPAESDLSRWRDWLAKQAVDQPFAQVDRECYDGDPSASWARNVTAASLYALIRHGWRWGPTGRAATRNSITRPLGAAGTVVLLFGPGLSVVSNPAGEPDQTIESLTLESLTHRDLAVFGDLSRVTRSELIGDLRRLGSAPANGHSQ